MSKRPLLHPFHSPIPSLGAVQVKEQVRILEESGQLPLAYVAAATHGLHEEAERIGQAIGDDDLPELPTASQLLLPPTPILKVRKRHLEEGKSAGTHSWSINVDNGHYPIYNIYA